MTDRRQRKSRAALQQALLDLIAEKPFAAITVDDIAARADVARATFYAHYADRQALLVESTRTLLEDLAQEVAAVSPQIQLVFSGAGLRAVFTHAAAHRDLYRLLLTGEGGREARGLTIEAFRSLTSAIFTRVVEAQRADPRIPMPALVTAFVGASILTLEAFVVDELEGDVEDRIRLLVQSQAYGFGWALGLEPGTFGWVDPA